MKNKHKLLFVDEDGEREFFKGMVTKNGGMLHLRRAMKVISFEQGETLEFSVEDFSGICWALFLFGNDLVGKLREKGCMMGFINDTAKVEVKSLPGGEL